MPAEGLIVGSLDCAATVVALSINAVRTGMTLLIALAPRSAGLKTGLHRRQYLGADVRPDDESWTTWFSSAGACVVEWIAPRSDSIRIASSTGMRTTPVG